MMKCEEPQHTCPCLESIVISIERLWVRLIVRETAAHKIVTISIAFKSECKSLCCALLKTLL